MVVATFVAPPSGDCKVPSAVSGPHPLSAHPLAHFGPGAPEVFAVGQRLAILLEIRAADLQDWSVSLSARCLCVCVLETWLELSSA